MDKRFSTLFLIFLLTANLASAVERDQVMTGIIDQSVDGETNQFNEAIETLLDFYKDVMLFSPDPADIQPMADEFVKILMPIYVIAIMITGFYWLFLSISPRSRAKAKGMLIKLILSMPFVLSSTAIFQLMLDLASLTTNFVFSLGHVDIGGFGMTIIFCIGVILAGGVIIAPVLLIFIFAVVLVMVGLSLLRYLFLFFMASIFPLALFFLFFDLTRDIGAKLMRYTLMFAFMPAIQAFFIVFTITALNGGIQTTGFINDLAGFFAIFGLVIGGCIMIIVSPFLMLGLMKWVGIGMVGWSYGNMGSMGNRYSWGSRASIGMMFTGALLAGEGASSLPLAAGLWFIQELGPHGHAGPNQSRIIKQSRRRFMEQRSERHAGPKTGKTADSKPRRVRFADAEVSKEGHLKLAQHFEKNGEYQRALDHYVKATPEEAKFEMNDSFDLSSGGEFKEPQEKLSATQEKNLNIGKGNCYIELAKAETNSQLKKEQLKLATESFGKAEAHINPDSKEATDLAKRYSKIAGKQKQIGDLEGASYSYERAMAMDPSNPEYSYKRAEILFERK